MLNLAAALKKRGGVIAGYLQRLHTLRAEKLHSEVAKVSLDDYHQSLSAMLHEQMAMLRDENAPLLLRVVGQLPEAAVIPTARLGLLAGLADVDEWEQPILPGCHASHAAAVGHSLKLKWPPASSTRWITVAPNFSLAVRDYVLFTPDDLEERLALTDGNIHHVDGRANQLLWQRPLPELAAYTTPIRNFYLCGAGIHPWGEVNGGPGYNAAQRILNL